MLIKNQVFLKVYRELYSTKSFFSDLFYVRNHLPVPDVDVNEYELEITGLDVKESTLTLDDIKKFPKHTVTVAIQCAGNRRSEMVKVSCLNVCLKFLKDMFNSNEDF